MKIRAEVAYTRCYPTYILRISYVYLTYILRISYVIDCIRIVGEMHILWMSFKYSAVYNCCPTIIIM